MIEITYFGNKSNRNHEHDKLISLDSQIDRNTFKKFNVHLKFIIIFHRN